MKKIIGCGLVLTILLVVLCGCSNAKAVEYAQIAYDYICEKYGAAEPEGNIRVYINQQTTDYYYDEDSHFEDVMARVTFNDGKIVVFISEDVEGIYASLDEEAIRDMVKSRFSGSPYTFQENTVQSLMNEYREKDQVFLPSGSGMKVSFSEIQKGN